MNLSPLNHIVVKYNRNDIMRKLSRQPFLDFHLIKLAQYERAGRSRTRPDGLKALPPLASH
jgi:hypothetical protein